MIWTIVDMSKPSRGCSDDCRSFDSVSLPQGVEESLSHSFQETNVDKTGLDASDNETSSSVELVNAIDSIFEAEEQIEILQKIVPDWPCKKVVSSGDTMYCIKNASDLDSVRSRLLSHVTKEDEC
ncbi:hypothetical protein MtrunA17_Chr6g0482371 [Medicago truncatula]|uniref:Uncharacterized protein n=1 Tax=Medicago truncatula TaxID=3880 RepID=A0A396HP13_MEDTR|nr:hypothetical protein MtrunA17_Chr6g0482371 [Medicago truncatula]